MSEDTRSPSTSTAAAEGEPLPASTTTVTHYQQVSTRLTGALDDFRAAIPTLEPVTPEAKAFIRRKKRIPQQFVIAAVGSLALSSDLQGVKQFSTEASNDDAQFIEGLTPLFMNVLLLAQQLQTTIEKRRARLAGNAQKIYAVARALTLDNDSPEILSHVENMKRARKATNRPKAKAADKPPAPPTTIGVKAEGGAAA